MTKEDFYTFMNSKTLTVISTTHASGTPEAAVIGFGQDEDLQIVFGTDNTSRKYANLVRDPHVAFVIGWDNAETIQYEGTARELRSDEIDIVRETYWKKNPRAEEYHELETERYFIVTPKWVRYTDLKSDPWKIEELRF